MTSTRRLLIRNTRFNAAGRLWEALIGLILIRYVLERIGAPSYGLWALVSAFTGYVALLDLGIGSAFVKYIAEDAARADYRRMSTLVSTGIAFYLAFSAVLVAIGWPAVDALIALAEHFDLAPAPRDADILSDLRFLLRWGLVLFGISGCAGALSAVQAGLQRMDVSNVLSVAASIVKAAATVILLESGYGVRGLIYVNFIVLAFFAAASIAAARKLAPQLRLTPGCVSRAAFRRLFGYGWRAQVSRLSNLVMMETDKVIVAVVMRDMGLVALYELGVSLANKTRQLPNLLVSAMVPAASDLDARAEYDRLRQLYLRSTKYVAAVAVPVTAFAIGSADLLMRAWMGDAPGMDTAAWVLRIIAFGYLANVIPGAGVSVALGMGRPGLQMKAGLIATASNIGLTIAFYYAFGFWGIPAATAASMFLAWAWFARAMKPVIGVGASELLRSTAAWPVLASLPGLAVCLAVDWAAGPVATSMPNLALSAATAMGFAALYLLALRATPHFDSFDLAFIEESLALHRVPGFAWWARRSSRA